MTLERPGVAHSPYHGTCMPHVHVIFWCTADIQETRLFDWPCADLATEFPPLARSCCGTQCQGLPLRDNSAWQEGKIPLRRTQEDEAAGVCPFPSPHCLSEVCHTNVTEVNKVAGVISYMTKVGRYIRKDNVALPEKWLQKSSTGFNAAVTMLRKTQPSSAQMINLQTTGRSFHMSCAKKEVIL